MEGPATGTTPDGIHLAPTTTPVASLDGSKPNSVTKPPAPSGGSGGPQPSNQNPSTSRPKHWRAINGEVGRGKTPQEIRQFALQLAQKYPDDLEDVLESVKLAIAERDMKGK